MATIPTCDTPSATVVGIVVPELQPRIQTNLNTNRNHNYRNDHHYHNYRNNGRNNVPMPIDTTNDNVPLNRQLFILQITKIWLFITLLTIGIVSAVYLNGCVYGILQNENIGYRFLAFVTTIAYIVLLDYACVVLQNHMKSYKISRFDKNTIIDVVLTMAFVLIVIFVICDFAILKMQYRVHASDIAINNTNSTNITTVQSDACNMVSVLHMTNSNALILILQIHVIMMCIYTCSFINFADCLIVWLLVSANIGFAATAINAFANEAVVMVVAIIALTIASGVLLLSTCVLIKYPNAHNNRDSSYV